MRHFVDSVIWIMPIATAEGNLLPQMLSHCKYHPEMPSKNAIYGKIGENRGENSSTLESSRLSWSLLSPVHNSVTYAVLMLFYFLVHRTEI